MSDFDEDDPEVIRAKAEAKERVLKARAQLHPAAQAIYSFFDSIDKIITSLGCWFVILLIVFSCLIFFANPELVKVIQVLRGGA